MIETFLRVNWEIASDKLELDGMLTLNTGETVIVDLLPCDKFFDHYLSDAGWDIITPDVEAIVKKEIENQIRPDFSKMKFMEIANWK